MLFMTIIKKIVVKIMKYSWILSVFLFLKKKQRNWPKTIIKLLLNLFWKHSNLVCNIMWLIINNLGSHINQCSKTSEHLIGLKMAENLILTSKLRFYCINILVFYTWKQWQILAEDFLNKITSACVCVCVCLRREGLLFRLQKHVGLVIELCRSYPSSLLMINSLQLINTHTHTQIHTHVQSSVKCWKLEEVLIDLHFFNLCCRRLNLPTRKLWLWHTWILKNSVVNVIITK